MYIFYNCKKINNLFIYYRVTKPGGYIELLEICKTFKGSGPVLSKIYDARK
jgi:hypothetical protein